MAGSSLIGNLAVSLSMETAAFQKSAAAAETRAQGLGSKMAGIGKSMAGLGAALAGGVILAGVTSAVTGAFEMASALSEASEKLGLTVEGLQRLRVAAQESGVSNEQLDAAMVKLNKSMGELQLGSTAATKSFAAIGLSAEALKGKSPDQALSMIADALNKIPDPQTRVALGAQIMGKNFAQLIPMISGGSAQLEKYAQQSQRNGEISTENAKKLDELADAWGRTKTSIGVSAANLIASVGGLFEKVDAGLRNMQAGADAFDAAVVDMAKNAVSWVNNMVTGIGSAITGRLTAIWDGAKAKIESVKMAFFHMYDAVVGHSYVPDMVEGIGRSMSELQAIMVDPALSATQKVGASFQALAGTIGGLFGKKAGGILGALGAFVSGIAPLFGKGGVPVVPASNTIGMASGGSGVFGGRGGTDRNLLSLNGSPIARVSKGEHFAVSPANNNSQRIQIVPSAYFDVVVDQRAAGVAVPLVGRGAVASAQGAQMAMARQSRRRLA